MSGRFVRASSFRHVHGDPEKSDKCYANLSINFNGDGGHVAGNGTYLAFAYGGAGGAMQIMHKDQTGRNANNTRVALHKAKVLDMAFNPFVDNVIASVSEDNKVNVVQFADFGKEGMKEAPSAPTAQLVGHQKKGVHLQWHPTASNILGTVSYDKTVKVWDVEAQAEAYSVDLGGEGLYMDWNSSGSLFCSTSKGDKAKMLTISDPRQSTPAQCVPTFAGTKAAHALWADNHGKIIVVGFTKTSGRQYSLYDPKNMSEALVVKDIDQASGLVIPHYDPDTSMLYLAGKGDSSVKYFELTAEAPYLHFLSEHRGSAAQKGIGFLPKRACDVSKCEVMSSLRVLRDSIEPVHFCVPRKSDMFQGDLFPDCYAGEATNTNADWMGGKDAEPKLRSMDPEKAEGGERKAVVMAVKKSPAELQAELDKALARIAELEAEVAALKK